MKRNSLFLFVLIVLFVTILGEALARWYPPTTPLKTPLRTGWVIGQVVGDGGVTTAVILHTRNGGEKWVVQADGTEWVGHNGNDISAVDGCTAWAALGSESSDSGIILHTTDGGATWTEQTLPEGVGPIKGIKGLSPRVAWAVSITGTILHTTNGGKRWTIVEHPSVPIYDVNRMDAIGCIDSRIVAHFGCRDSRVAPHFDGRDSKVAAHSRRNPAIINANIWIVDEQGGHLGMIHSLYNGDIWRQEFVPYHANSMTNGMHMVSAYSPRVVWAAAWFDGTFFRTLDGGETWHEAACVGGADDIDDMCATSADVVWAVQNRGIFGVILRVRPADDESFEIDEFNPVPNIYYSGLTCSDDQTVLVVGTNLLHPESVPVIISTNDGGQTWVRHRIPVDNIQLWKTSFVGARR